MSGLKCQVSLEGAHSAPSISRKPCACLKWQQNVSSHGGMPISILTGLQPASRCFKKKHTISKLDATEGAAIHPAANQQDAKNQPTHHQKPSRPVWQEMDGEKAQGRQKRTEVETAPTTAVGKLSKKDINPGLKMSIK